MRVLYIAYSCSDIYGSEDKIGWNVPLESAKYNQVYVITKEEHRAHIEERIRQKATADIRFFFVDIPRVYKRVFKGSIYPARLIFWQSRAFKLARRICREESIDVIHQITPVEFRSVGNYGKIKGTTFLCGPIAGGQSIPKGLRYYAKNHRFSEWVREIANRTGRAFLRLNGRLNRCKHIFYANRETREYLKSAVKAQVSSEVLTDVSVREADISKEKTASEKTHGKTVFLVAARLVYLKGHSFLFDALAQIKERNDIICKIAGDGPLSERLKCEISEKGLDETVELLGKVPHGQLATLYDSADVLILPTLREATGSVILEAMSRGLPVITVAGFGGADILNSDTGWLYSGNTREEYVTALKDIILECASSPDEVKRKGENALKAAENYTFEKRARYYQDIYESI